MRWPYKYWLGKQIDQLAANEPTEFEHQVMRERRALLVFLIPLEFDAEKISNLDLSETTDCSQLFCAAPKAGVELPLCFVHYRDPPFSLAGLRGLAGGAGFSSASVSSWRMAAERDSMPFFAAQASSFSASADVSATGV
jgi:hypothetical protein